MPSYAANLLCILPGYVTESLRLEHPVSISSLRLRIEGSDLSVALLKISINSKFSLHTAKSI